MSLERTGPSRRGFTIMELLVVILVILALMGLLIGGIRLVHGSARGAADRAAVNALKQGITLFEQQVGFLPPLVKDANPLVGNKPQVYSPSKAADLSFLQTQPDPATLPDLRFSLYSIPYYVIGVLDMPREPSNPNSPPVDGVEGPGFRAPKRDGSFETAGRVFQPFYDVSRNEKAIFTEDAAAGKVFLRDRNGVAFRYYRWEHGKPGTDEVTDLKDLNIPVFLGTPQEKETLKTARYAIVGAGPNGIFGNEHQIYAADPNHPQAMTEAQMMLKLGIQDPAKIWDVASADNVIEVGQ